MGSNAFGTLFRITTWGESHGKAIGVVIDGCPAGLPISEEEIQVDLNRRQPGRNPYISSRNEKDKAEIYSGVFEGKTTGTPISIVIFNQDADSSKYTPIKDLLRPGHANYTYLAKYGIFDYRGGGRASARETACRVAAGSVAKKLLAHFGIEVVAYVKKVGDIEVTTSFSVLKELREKVEASPIFCPHKETELAICAKIEEIKKAQDSLGGVVELVSSPLPVGLGDPIYEKLEANLGRALLSLPASKGVEFGSGFAAACMHGSSHNDLFMANAQGEVVTQTNQAGGILGGISQGMPLCVRTVFKPTSSIERSQMTIDRNQMIREFKLPKDSRHDPCTTLRAVPVVEAMGALVLADALLMNRSSRL